MPGKVRHLRQIAELVGHQRHNERLRVVRGDVLDAAAVRLAVTGHDAVVSALGHSSRTSAMLYPATTHIVAAMAVSGVRRLIWVSSHGVGDSRGRSGVLFERLLVSCVQRA